MMAVRPTQLEITDEIRIPYSELQLVAVRSSGPGGQNVNKVSSKIQLRWNVEESAALPDPVRQRFLMQQKRRISRDGVFQLASQRFRDQEKNRDDCLERLQELIRQATAMPQVRIKTRTPRRAKEQRLRQKRARSELKRDRRPPRMD